MVDYFRNSIFLKDPIRDMINTRLSHHFNDVSEELIKNNIIANVYLTGSLSRGEPAVSANGMGRYCLFSDIDFIVAVPNDSVQKKWILGLADRLNELFPDFKNSVMVVSSKSITRFKSCIGKDLMISLNKPVFKSIYIGKSTNNIITNSELLESIVHQFSGYYLNTSVIFNESKDIFGKDLNYCYIKMILECLRVQLYDQGEASVGYFDIYHKKYDKRIASILKPSIVDKLIIAREYYGKYEIPNIDRYSFFQKVLLTPLNIGILDEGDIEIIQKITEKLRCKSQDAVDLLTLYQVAISLLVLGIESNDIYRQELLYLSFKTIKKIYQLGLSNDLKFRQRMNSIIKSNNESKNHNAKELLKVMSTLRCEYLNELTKKNTGEYGFSDIQKHIGSKN